MLTLFLLVLSTLRLLPVQASWQPLNPAVPPPDLQIDTADTQPGSPVYDRIFDYTRGTWDADSSDVPSCSGFLQNITYGFSSSQNKTWQLPLLASQTFDWFASVWFQPVNYTTNSCVNLETGGCSLSAAQVLGPLSIGDTAPTGDTNVNLYNHIVTWADSRAAIVLSVDAWYRVLVSPYCVSLYELNPSTGQLNNGWPQSICTIQPQALVTPVPLFGATGRYADLQVWLNEPMTFQSGLQVYQNDNEWQTTAGASSTNVATHSYHTHVELAHTHGVHSSTYKQFIHLLDASGVTGNVVVPYGYPLVLNVVNEDLERYLIPTSVNNYYTTTASLAVYQTPGPLGQVIGFNYNSTATILPQLNYANWSSSNSSIAVGFILADDTDITVFTSDTFDLTASLANGVSYGPLVFDISVLQSSFYQVVLIASTSSSSGTNNQVLCGTLTSWTADGYNAGSNTQCTPSNVNQLVTLGSNFTFGGTGGYLFDIITSYADNTGWTAEIYADSTLYAQSPCVAATATAGCVGCHGQPDFTFSCDSCTGTASYDATCSTYSPCGLYPQAAACPFAPENNPLLSWQPLASSDWNATTQYVQHPQYRYALQNSVTDALGQGDQYLTLRDVTGKVLQFTNALYQTAPTTFPGFSSLYTGVYPFDNVRGYSFPPGATLTALPLISYGLNDETTNWALSFWTTGTSEWNVSAQATQDPENGVFLQQWSLAWVGDASNSALLFVMYAALPIQYVYTETAISSRNATSDWTIDRSPQWAEHYVIRHGGQQGYQSTSNFTVLYWQYDPSTGLPRPFYDWPMVLYTEAEFDFNIYLYPTNIVQANLLTGLQFASNTTNIDIWDITLWHDQILDDTTISNLYNVSVGLNITASNMVGGRGDTDYRDFYNVDPCLPYGVYASTGPYTYNCTCQTGWVGVNCQFQQLTCQAKQPNCQSQYPLSTYITNTFPDASAAAVAQPCNTPLPNIPAAPSVLAACDIPYEFIVAGNQYPCGVMPTIACPLGQYAFSKTKGYSCANTNHSLPTTCTDCGPCNNGLWSYIDYYGWTCFCNLNYTGPQNKSCDTLIDYQTSTGINPCPGYSDYVHVDRTTFECACNATKDVRYRTGVDPCAPHGEYTSADGNGYTCLCNPGWYGQNCTLPMATLCEPEPPPCTAATEECVQITAGYSKCVTPQLCQLQPCHYGGICTQTSATNYTCQCPDGVKGLRCEQPDPCREPNFCNGGVCKSQWNEAAYNWTYQCQPCPMNFAGTNCEALNPCVQSSSTLCLNGGTCSAYFVASTQSWTPVCKCPNNARGPTCESIDPCSALALSSAVTEPLTCYNGGTCKSTYFADTSLTDVVHGLSSTSNNLPGDWSAVCYCNSLLWSGDQCTVWNDPCLTPALNICPYNTDCHSMINTAYLNCTCIAGTNRSDDSGPCTPYCQNMPSIGVDPTTCACTNNTFNTRYGISAQFMVEYPTCDGYCNPSFGSLLGTSCRCDAAHTGKTCDIAVCNPSASAAGSAINVTTCSCAPPFYNPVYGHDSQLGRVNSDCPYTCDEQHAGLVVNQTTQQLYCDCIGPWAGPSCDDWLNPCNASNVCSNQGECLTAYGSAQHLCACNDNYSGLSCEVHLDPCAGTAGERCQNGGECVVVPHVNFTSACSCVAGYFGDTCSYAFMNVTLLAQVDQRALPFYTTELLAQMTINTTTPTVINVTTIASQPRLSVAYTLQTTTSTIQQLQYALLHGLFASNSYTRYVIAINNATLYAEAYQDGTSAPLVSAQPDTLATTQMLIGSVAGAATVLLTMLVQAGYFKRLGIQRLVHTANVNTPPSPAAHQSRAGKVVDKLFMRRQHSKPLTAAAT